MRKTILSLLILVSCGVTYGAGVDVQPAGTTDGLGMDNSTAGALGGPPPVDMELPLPGGADKGLPRFRANPDAELELEQPGVTAFPELPGLSDLTAIELEVELPGIDGLPIAVRRRTEGSLPAMPGFDGLPLGSAYP